jgi:alpha-galactosidase
MRAVYQKMAVALRKTGRPIVYSLCQYGMNNVWEWGPKAGGNLWRTTFDIADEWDAMANIGFNQAELAEWAGPGHWNDPDMLEVGNGGMSHEEYRTHMSLWALLAAPLLAGHDVRKSTPEDLELLTNPEVITINQDPLGKQARRVRQDGEQEIWLKELQDGKWAVGLFNRSNQKAEMIVPWAELGISGKIRVRDAWLKKNLGTLNQPFTANIPPHGSVLLVVESRK